MKLKEILVVFGILVSMNISNAQTNTLTFGGIKPVLNIDEEKIPNGMLRYTALTGYRQGLEPGSSYVINQKTGAMLVYKYNMSIQDMVIAPELLKPSRIILEVKDPSSYRYDPKYGSRDEWLRKNGHCFEMMLPDASLFKAGETSREWSKKGGTFNKELARVFNIEFGFEKRLVDALVLVRTSTKDKIKSAGKGERSYTPEGKLNNIEGLGRILSSLLYTADFPPVVDETGYSDKVDLDLKLEKGMSLEGIRKVLKRYDLDLKLEKREYEMLVIREIN